MASPPAQSSSNVDLITLAIAAVASGIAAYVTSKLWPGGTLVSAAMTPVIVALVKEGLTKTSDVTTRRVRDLTTGQTIEVEVPREDVPKADEPFDPLAPVTPPPPTEVADTVTVHRDGAVRRRRWRLAIVTGLLAFVIAAVVVTVPQLIANSGGSGGNGTTYFGGSSSNRDRDRDRDRDATPTATPSDDATPTATATPEGDEETATPTATPEATETPSATPTVSPTPTVSATPTP